MLSEASLYSWEMLQVFGIMVALLIDVMGIAVLLGGLIFKFVVFLVGLCKGEGEKGEQKEGKQIEVAVVGQKNHGYNV